MKILIIYATAGAGHRRAAEAIFNAIKTENNHQAILVDSLDYTNPTFKKIYSQGYSSLVARLPQIWAFMYYFLDNPIVYKLIYPFRRLIVKFNSKPLVDYINSEKPDVIIATQFFANEIISRVKKQGKINPRLICVITDFGLHSFWLSDTVDIYTVGAMKTKADLISRGVPEEKIKVFGIPIDPKFYEPFNRNDLSQKFAIKPDRFTGLIMTGAIGIGPIEEIVEKLKSDIQLLVVCGTNKRLYEQLKQKESDSVKVFGLVNNVHELMSISDFIITKPGGLSVSEALIKNLPMIFIAAIPGQETRNARFIVDGGMGAMPKDVNSLVNVVYAWKNDLRLFSKIKENIKRVAFPNPSREIINILQ